MRQCHSLKQSRDKAVAAPGEPYTAADLLRLLLLAALMVVQFLPVVRPVISWEDESLYAATSLALLRGHAQQPPPTVLADFPATHSLVGFYGPTAFWMGELAFKLFGFSRLTWRLYTFSGNLLFYAAAYLLFRGFGFSRRLAMLAPLALALSFEQSMSATTTGRLDAWAMGGVLLGVVFALRASQQAGGSARVHWLLSGITAGIFLSLTPRVWLFWFAAWAVLVLVALCSSAHRVKLLVGCALANAAALVTIWLMLLPAGFTPFTLLHNVANGSHGDKINASPLMGGAWGFAGWQTSVLLYALIAALLLTTALYRRRLTNVPPQAFWFVLISVGTAVLQILLLGRSFQTTFYWGPLLLLSVTAAMLFVWQSREQQTPVRSLVLAGGATIFVFTATLQVSRLTQAFLAQTHDAPGPLKTLIAANIPQGSVVYGPPGTFFFPIEQAGSSYRYPTEHTVPGLASVPNMLWTESPLTPTLCRFNGYVLWPNNAAMYAMPPNLQAALGPKIAEIPDTPRSHSRAERLLMRVPAANVGENPNGVALYGLQKPTVCPSSPQHS